MTGFVRLRKCTEVILVFCFFIFCLAMIGISPRTAFADAQCKIILSIDRSGSISDSQWQQMGVQVQNLLRTGITGIPNLSIAMWTFSHGDPADNYNAPHGTDYIQASALGDPVQQDTLINKIFFGTNSTSPPNFGTNHPPFLVREGGTDYQQAFGYSTDPNTGATSSNPSVRSIINGNPDGFVLITDGAPNYPGGIDGASGLNNNSDALNAAQSARAQYSVPAYGAYVTDPSSPAPDLTGLNYTMNGPNDAVGPVDYGNIEAFLEAKIADACGTVPPASYNLTPSVNPADDQPSIITDDTPPSFKYTVNNDGDTTTTDWQIFDVLLNPGVSYRGTAVEQCFALGCSLNTADACSILQSAVSTIQCSTSQDDTSVDPNSGTNKVITKPSVTLAENKRAKVDNIASLGPGTQICRGLRISRPTQTGVPPYRFVVACLPIAKAPLLQIHGGDVRVGRSFDKETSYDNSGIYTNTYQLKGADVPTGLTFGSWVEYGALAPGRILGMASLAGYKGGAIPENSTCGNDSSPTISMTNILTFANYNSNASDNRNGCGHFPSGAVGTIPDVVSAVKNFNVPTSTISTPFQLPNSTGALYKYHDPSQNPSPLVITASTIPTSGTFIIDASEDDVEITGDIKRADGAKIDANNLKNLPQLIIIAKNITIKASVKRIDAWLIAKGPDDNNGVINTCSEIHANDSTTCKDQLSINGPIMARALQPWRTTIYNGVCKLEGNYNGPFGCVWPATNPVDKPAEIFSLPGASLLWAASQDGTTPRAQTTYTIELPPYY